MAVYPHEWPDERTEKLREMWAAGATGTQIAEVLKVSRCAVMGKVCRLNLAKRERVAALTNAEKNARRRVARAKQRALAAPKLRVLAMTVTTKPKPAEVKQPAPPVGAIPLVELGQNQCRWPVNDPPRGGRYLFCGCKTGMDRPYCEYHRVVACSPSMRRSG